MNFRLAALLASVLIAVSAVHAQPVRVAQDARNNAATIVVDAPDGIVQWRNVARGIASAENLDEEAVAGLFPPGTLNLNTAASQWIISGLNIGLGRAVTLRIERNRSTPTGLRVAFDRDALRRALNMVKGIARQIVFNWGDGQDSRYGLFIDEDWQQFSAQHPLVVIVHGYSSSPEEFDALRERLRDAGYPCALFSYPNDAAVAHSGRQLSSALQAFNQQFAQRNVTLIAHSMGGLLSRVVIEDPQVVRPPNVQQLIMVATPNHGSNLARVPVSLDVWENWLDGEPDTVRSVLYESISDGLNEARFDLQPESQLLERLNGLPRNPDVRYSLLLGNQGPATRAQLDELRGMILGMQDSNAVLRALGPRLDELLVDLDELVDELGDGAVALERGRLEGVEDTIVLRFNHSAITTALTGPNAEPLVAAILERLERR